ncbi:Arf-GAP with coiled-coil, ANK repeat and PH domain-containing protein 3 [Merluccius polli]|uniref:Arf-GAP with coiled-coil, ANK repeat and PH domain-containing protein n=1 Tax=Merluccius polli TaxID=89951 RepID=A0AA47MA12_MERPO|nr:Arf-GAP with coiled-coil, ANK repeat and PH domain-containing protein 3 [Merluccius polli]
MTIFTVWVSSCRVNSPPLPPDTGGAPGLRCSSWPPGGAPGLRRSSCSRKRTATTRSTMDTLLDFEECLQDSPVFRVTVDQFESDVAGLELQVNKVMKCCANMLEAGQVYSTANQLFVSSLAEFSGRHKKEDIIAKCLRQFNQGLQEMVNFHTMLLDQTQRAINQQLTSLLTQFFPPLGEIRREFVRIGDDLETAALKNAQVSRHKASDAERASHLLIATRKCYQHFALDYCLQLNNFKIQQEVDILNSVFSYFHAQYTFFHQGFDLLKDLEPTMKTMATQVRPDLFISMETRVPSLSCPCVLDQDIDS